MADDEMKMNYTAAYIQILISSTPIEVLSLPNKLYKRPNSSSIDRFSTLKLTPWACWGRCRAWPSSRPWSPSRAPPRSWTPGSGASGLWALSLENKGYTMTLDFMIVPLLPSFKYREVHPVKNNLLLTFK